MTRNDLIGVIGAVLVLIAAVLAATNGDHIMAALFAVIGVVLAAVSVVTIRRHREDDEQASEDE